ncbi:MAG: hypothetical protein JHC26_09025 [Thermofilum sp.]|jgi:hypothetical protein|uniref:hypothetical protein n=1 Tax=Thermofilum sp. TaxID=1961369 RepID=UPI002585C77F|nr:hypothetical protein [Thermofilum sp.]MCI4409221.1 hypothetical protein [Thermofilum sp.]
MTIKVYRKTFTINASSTWTRQSDSLPTPAGYNRVLREVRLSFSATSNAYLRLYVENEMIAEISAEVWNKYMLPYYFDTQIPTGKSLYFETSNSNSSNVTLTVECIVEETTA